LGERIASLEARMSNVEAWIRREFWILVGILITLIGLLVR